MTNALHPAPSVGTFYAATPSGTLQKGTGGYVMHSLGQALPSVYDYGHMLPSKAFDTHPIQTPAQRANAWGFFFTNLGKLIYSPKQFKSDTAQGKAEVDNTPASPGNLYY